MPVGYYSIRSTYLSYPSSEISPPSGRSSSSAPARSPSGDRAAQLWAWCPLVHVYSTIVSTWLPTCEIQHTSDEKVAGKEAAPQGWARGRFSGPGSSAVPVAQSAGGHVACMASHASYQHAEELRSPFICANAGPDPPSTHPARHARALVGGFKHHQLALEVRTSCDEQLEAREAYCPPNPSSTATTHQRSCPPGASTPGHVVMPSLPPLAAIYSGFHLMQPS